ncbi:hypothetical protein ACM66B_002120 [Microbotryomycetes sp. NB124-2]
MVSFSCEACNDTVKKPKLPNHYNNCGAPFTCIDCNVTFYSPNEWKTHTSCISEEQKYQKTLYKAPKAKNANQQQQQQQEIAQPADTVAATETVKADDSAMKVDEPALAPKSKKDKKRKREEDAETVEVTGAAKVEEQPKSAAAEPVEDVKTNGAEVEPVSKKAKKDKKNKKSKKEDKAAEPVAPAAATPVGTDAVAEADEPSLSIDVAEPSTSATPKKAKKEKKEKKVKQPKADDSAVAKGDYRQLRSKLQSFLGQIWPTQLKAESKPLVQHQKEIIKQVQESTIFKKEYQALKTDEDKAKFDEWVWDLFMRGCHIGGKKPKRSLSLKWTRATMQGYDGPQSDVEADAVAQDEEEQDSD